MKAQTQKSKRHTILGNAAAGRDTFAEWLTSWRRRLGYFSIFAALPAVLSSHTAEARAEDVEKPKPNVAERQARFIDKLKSCNNKPDFLRRQSNFRLPHQRGSLDLVTAFAGNDDCPGRAIPTGNYTAATPYTDTGNTTGANNSVTYGGWIDYCYYGYSADGPDQVYSFTLSGRGSNPRIEVSTTSATYRPLIYVLDGRQGGCPGGTNNGPCSMHVANWASSPGGTAVLDSNGIYYLPLNTPLHLLIDSTGAAPDPGPYTLRIQDLSIRPTTQGARKTVDFDDDGRGDVAVYRPSNGTWYIQTSNGQFGTLIRQFGLPNDKIAIGKFDSDRFNDIAIFRDGTWWLQYYVRYSGPGEYYETVQFGLPNDIPVPADYNGDGRDELAVYRNGTWWMLNLASDQISVVQFGLAGDKPVPADYDGDGRVDQAVYRGNGEWHLNQSTQGYAVAQFGLASDIPVTGDYDGDGKTDLAVYRDGVWWLSQSTVGTTAFQFGLATDTPAPADYDGDGKTDAAIYRNGQWWLRQSTSGVAVQQFGLAGDKPVQAAYLP